MSKGFWSQLNQPFIGLSPMDGITDLPFRLVVVKYGKPDIIYTEFVAVEALVHGVERAFQDFLFFDIERPIVAQLYGNNPKLFYNCAQIVAELGFDGVDINMGCPAKSVEQRGAGAGLIKTPDLAVEIIKAVQAGVAGWVENGVEYNKFPPEAKPDRVVKRLDEVQEYRQNLIIELNKIGFDLRLVNNKRRKSIPVSVKTRIGYNEPVTQDWIATIANTGIAALSIHGRTLREGYKGKADWREIKKAVEVVSNIRSKRPLIIGNGDIKSVAEGVGKSNETGVDGVLIGRASIGNPWVFNKVDRNIEWKQMKAVMLEHARLHYTIKGPRAFVQMRRILAEYIQGFPGASELRNQLVRVNNPEEVKKILLNLDKSRVGP